MTEHCCEMLQDAVDGGAVLNQPKLQMRGRLLNEIDSDYAVRSPEDRPARDFASTRESTAASR